MATVTPTIARVSLFCGKGIIAERGALSQNRWRHFSEDCFSRLFFDVSGKAVVLEIGAVSFGGGGTQAEVPDTQSLQ